MIDFSPRILIRSELWSVLQEKKAFQSVVMATVYITLKGVVLKYRLRHMRQKWHEKTSLSCCTNWSFWFLGFKYNSRSIRRHTFVTNFFFSESSWLVWVIVLLLDNGVFFLHFLRVHSRNGCREALDRTLETAMKFFRYIDLLNWKYLVLRKNKVNLFLPKIWEFLPDNFTWAEIETRQGEIEPSHLSDSSAVDKTI